LSTCSLQFAKAGSAATLSQQKKQNSEDLQRGRVNISSFFLLGTLQYILNGSAFEVIGGVPSAHTQMSSSP
jgi:hypothetical protein